EMTCVWLKAVERSEKLPWREEIHDLRPPVDNRLWGTSSWRNYLTKRDKQTPPGWDVRASGRHSRGALRRHRRAPDRRHRPPRRPARALRAVRAVRRQIGR